MNNSLYLQVTLYLNKYIYITILHMIYSVNQLNEKN